MSKFEKALKGFTIDETEKLLGEIGIYITDDNGSFLSLYEVLDDISAKWGSLSSTEKDMISNILTHKTKSLQKE